MIFFKSLKKPLFLFLFLIVHSGTWAQTSGVNPRPLLLDEYKKALTYTIKDLDQDSYVKFDNAYVLDRYEGRKPYFITGYDGLKKRMDLYRFIAREGMQEIGLMVFYTNEAGKKYQILVPDFTADAKVWDLYFKEVDRINQEEKNFSLKLSYILSKELSFQKYKILNAGKDLKEESATYGNDICFPGEEKVRLLGGKEKMIKDILPGDEVLSPDPLNHTTQIVRVKELTIHPSKNYALAELVLISSREEDRPGGKYVQIQSLVIKGTPNHPMQTMEGLIKLGDIEIGQKILCENTSKTGYEPYIVLSKSIHSEGSQPVYNIVADKGKSLILNGVMVLQK